MGVVTAYIEIVPTDAVKYEVDKPSGILRVDRPQKYSNVSPCLYGFVPRTLCAQQVGAFAALRLGLPPMPGDGDPLDICVLSERPVVHGDVLVECLPIGGLRMIDRGEADDKLVAVLAGDDVFGRWRDIDDCPAPLLDRLRHYFLTYKQPPDGARPVEIPQIYGVDDARQVLELSLQDYEQQFGGL